LDGDVPAAWAKDPQTYAITGAAMEVHREMGGGFLEAVYHEALKIEFTQRELPWRHEVHLPLFYKGQKLPLPYRAQFVLFGEVIVEVKSITQLTGVDRAQAIHYLRATGFARALLLNFGGKSLGYERVVLNY
jgi:GxxExxY protein